MAPPSTGAASSARFNHPWLAPLPPGRARMYDIGYKVVTTALIAFSAFAFFEVGRGTYYIMGSNKARREQEASAETPSQQ